MKGDIALEEYKSNSHRSKNRPPDSDKKVEKIISGTAKAKKKNDIQKFTDVFISEDVGNVKSYILLEVLIPAIKKAISDIVTDGIAMILYGESGSGRKSSTASKVSYRRYYDEKRTGTGHVSLSRQKSGYNYDDVVLDNRGEAEDVLSRMDELIEAYGLVSVADLYDLVGINGNYTDNKYGWTDIRNASAIRVRDGYKLKLPKALPLN